MDVEMESVRGRKDCKLGVRVLELEGEKLWLWPADICRHRDRHTSKHRGIHTYVHKLREQ